MSSLILLLFYFFSKPNVYFTTTQHADSAVFPFESQTCLLKLLKKKLQVGLPLILSYYVTQFFYLGMGRDKSCWNNHM